MVRQHHSATVAGRLFQAVQNLCRQPHHQHLGSLSTRAWKHVPPSQIQLIAPHEDFCPKTYSHTSGGGTGLHGCKWTQSRCLLSPCPLNSAHRSSKAVCNVVTPTSPEWIEDRYSSFMQLSWITAWVFRFNSNLKAKRKHCPLHLSHSLSIPEIKTSDSSSFSIQIFLR